MATSSRTAKVVLGLTAVASFVALALQLYLSLHFATANGGSVALGLVMYLGFFTITTNLLVYVASLMPLAAPASQLGRFFVRPVAIGWVATSIIFVGIAYHLLLRHVWAPQGLQLLANVMLHYVVPILYLIFSLIALRGTRIRWVSPLWWSLYPLIYFIYALVRGAIIGSYPYGFIDASKLGYAVTFRNGVLLWLAFLVLAHVLMLIWRIGASDISQPGKTPL